MQSKLPIVILAFADGGNGQTRLPALSREAKKLHQLFIPLANQGKIDLRFYPQSTYERLGEDLKSLRRQVAIWHFGGHADQDRIKLVGAELTLSHLAPLIGRYWKPRLIFLNGCTTIGMVEPLLKAGVDVVIGSQGPVEDETAATFAQHFYESWLYGNTLGEAFELATQLLRATYTDTANTRHMSTEREQIGESEFTVFLRMKGAENLRFDALNRKKRSVPLPALVFTALVLMLGALLLWDFATSARQLKLKIRPNLSLLMETDTLNHPKSVKNPPVKFVRPKQDNGREFKVLIRDNFGDMPDFRPYRSLALKVIAPDFQESYAIDSTWASNIRIPKLLSGQRVRLFLANQNRILSNPEYVTITSDTEPLKIVVWPISVDFWVQNYDQRVAFEYVLYLKSQEQILDSFRIPMHGARYEYQGLISYSCIESTTGALQIVAKSPFAKMKTCYYSIPIKAREGRYSSGCECTLVLSNRSL